MFSPRIGAVLPFSIVAVACLGGGGTLRAGEEPKRFTPEVAARVEIFQPGGSSIGGSAAHLSPAESLKQLRAADGYVVELAAHEPVIRQPIDMQFDDRGRLWVVQYLQYPFPAGVTITSY
ncbi:MAG: hypothetical protein RIQ93_1689, partial [Verrucomicrobiota bacterium]